MKHLVWKLLRQHISPGQLTGFFLANLVGICIVMLGIQCYCDVAPLFGEADSIVKREYVIATKRISTLGGLTGKKSTFSPAEIEELSSQSFARQVGAFTPSLFKVTAGVGMQQAGISLSTEMFFESVPDAFVDVNLAKWQYIESERTIPIIIPRNYLNLYNFGFAQSRGLPKLSEGLMGLINLQIVLRANGRVEEYRGAIVGFSNRLNTILVPQSFMEQANARFAPGQTAHPSRLIVEVNNPTDPAIARYFDRHRYETEGDSLDAGRTTFFLRTLTALVTGVGVVICLLSFYMLMLSIYLLLEKNTGKLENLRLLGYTPTQVAMPYYLLTLLLNGVVLTVAALAVWWVRSAYMPRIADLIPSYQGGAVWPALVTGAVLFATVTSFNFVAIRHKIPMNKK